MISQAGPDVAETKGRDASRPPKSVSLVEAPPAASIITQTGGTSKNKSRNKRRGNQRRAAAANKAAALNEGEKLALCV